MLIDTLKFKMRLLEGGSEETEAQVLVEAMTEASTEHFATKADIEGLRGDTKTAIEALRGQMTHIKWMVTTLLIVNLGILGKLLFT